MGLLQKSTSGLGTVSVSGLRRVPANESGGVTRQASLDWTPVRDLLWYLNHLTITTDKNHGLHGAAAWNRELPNLALALVVLSGGGAGAGRLADDLRGVWQQEPINQAQGVS
jgi:hypothetical protein